ncbi:MAG: TonB-dependent receptor domain-containing protein, partial [Vicinamibacterales bacterium]
MTNARDRARTEGGHRYRAGFNRTWSTATLDVGFNKHNGEVSYVSVIREPANDILFQQTDVRTHSDEQLGGNGRDAIDERDNTGVHGTVAYLWRNHQFKGGLDWQLHENFRDILYVGGANYESIAARYSGGGVSAAQIATGIWSGLAFDVTNTSDFGGLIATIDARPDRARFYTAFDANGDGAITSGELGARLIFGSTSGNPQSAVNYSRMLQSTVGAQETASKGLSFYIQDGFTIGRRLTFNVGVRAEFWEHFATTGENIHSFPWEWAPRLSGVYDVFGNGRHKVSAFWGRYFDPIRNDMTNFAGTLTGSVLEEQVFVLGEWVTYRTRGGAVVQ